LLARPRAGSRPDSIRQCVSIEDDVQLACWKRQDEDAPVEIPETNYAKTVDGVHIAYQVFGEGPLDMVFSFGQVSNVDQAWEMPETATFVRRLASFSRVIVFDRRGNGLSDRELGATAPFEAGMDDIRAVMDAARSERALLFGFQDAGMLCALFAASFPERTSGLVLLNSSARGLWANDYPWGWNGADWEEYLQRLEEGWGTRAHTEEHMRWMAPSHPMDAKTVDRFARYFRAAGSPGSVVALERIVRDSDVRAILPSIQAPALVLPRGRRSRGAGGSGAIRRRADPRRDPRRASIR
jgi:pimeloyl-ACP methyl ester carboxylesterase